MLVVAVDGVGGGAEGGPKPPFQETGRFSENVWKQIIENINVN